jgi:hypothetical protein
MSRPPTSKYPAEFFLEFRSADRFLYRVSDLYVLGEVAGTDLLERLDDCHIYLLGKRPRLSVVPGSVEVADAVRFKVEYRLGSITHRSDVGLPRSLFASEEVTFEPSPYPHRELVTRDAGGKVVGYTLLANLAHIMEGVRQEAKDLEVVYVGKGLRRSAQDRLENHSTLQRILAEINSNAPEAEVFALVYSFKYLKNALVIKGGSPEVAGDAAGRQRERALAYRPSLDDQVSLIEASIISYFQTAEYNTQYLQFPDRSQRILAGVYEADFAAIVVQLDNTNIGELRTCSQRVPPRSTHYIAVDFRALEGKTSFLSLRDFAAPGKDPT